VTDWQYERTMTPEDLAVALKILGLDQAKLGRVIGRSERTMRRYIRGERTMPAAEVLLIRALMRYRVKPRVPEWSRELN
jgi:transcriptional regulator with XRE-family HTH domain